MRNPPPFIIDQVLPVGLHLVHSKPRAGLSPLLLRYAAAVALGGTVLGYQAQQGNVLLITPLVSPLGAASWGRAPTFTGEL